MGEVKRVALSLLISCIYLLGLAMGYSSNVGAFDRGAALYPIAEENVGCALSEQRVVPSTAVNALRTREGYISPLITNGRIVNLPGHVNVGRGAYVALHMLPGMAGRVQVWFSVIAGNSKGEWEQLGYYPRSSNIGVATKARFESDPQFRLQQQMNAMRSLVDQEILAGELELLKIKEDTATLLPGGHAAVAISREEYGKAAAWIAGEGVVATVGGELLGRGLSYAGKTGYLMASGSTIAESRLILGLSKELTTGALTSGSSMAGTPLYATAEGALANAGSAAKSAPAVADWKFYSMAFETTLAPTSYPGVSRYMHFKEANVALDAAMQSNPGLAKLGISVPRSSIGSILGTSPENWMWPHDTPAGVMQLVQKSQHPNIPGGIFWETMHRGGNSGFSIWGK